MISYLLRRRVRKMDVHDYAINWLTIASYSREFRCNAIPTVYKLILDDALRRGGGRDVYT